MDTATLILGGIISATIIGVILFIIAYSLKPNADGTQNSSKTPLTVAGVVFLIPIILVISLNTMGPGYHGFGPHMGGLGGFGIGGHHHHGR